MARQTLQIRIDHLGEDGLGYGLGEGFHVGVPGVAVNDIVDVELEHKSPHQKRAWGRVVKVVARGPAFTRPPCHHAAPIRGKCGGCPMMHLQMKEQRAYKNHRVEEALSGLPGYERVSELREAPGADAEGFRYRNRSNYLVFRPPGGRIHLGSRAPRSNHSAKMDGCLVNAPIVEELAQVLTQILNDRSIPVFPARSGLRYVTIRANAAGEALVDLVCAQKDPGWMNAVVDRLSAHPAVHGISVSVNRREGNAIRVNPSRLLWGTDSIIEDLNGLKLRLVADAFFQLNAAVAADMYDQAAKWTQDANVIWDLYCGVGGLGLSIARQQPGVKLFGCEATESAVRLARANAKENGIEGHFDVADLGKGVPRGWTPPDVIAVNPPRRGLDEKVTDLLRRVRPKQIIYMSCSTESLKRDLEAIMQAGYRIGRHAAWDMMPHTEHVETLVTLERTEHKPRQPRRTSTRGEAAAPAPELPEHEQRALAHRRRFARR